jgi:imidazolonepropionase
MTTLVTNIKQLVGVRQQNKLLRGKNLGELDSIENAYLVIEDGVIAEYGQMEEFKSEIRNPKSEKSRINNQISNVVEATSQFILPCWCDSHTHLVYAASREEEFVDRIKGKSYSEIAAKGGGILNSAKKLNDISEDQLFNMAWKRLQEISKQGTGAVEIKSGYGLTVDGELKMLRVIRKLKEKSAVSIKSTFLGAHTYPLEYKEDHKGYIDLILNKMLPVIAAEKLADYIDVFCENGFFSPTEAEIICRAGMRYGLKPKLHVNQLNSIGGIKTGIELNALSLDHLEVLTDDDIKILSSSWAGVCTLLPSSAFFLGIPFQPARKLIDAGCAIAIASDYNPGSSPSGNMNLVVAMSCIQMKMLPEETINAATLNGAYAMELQDEVGSITVGKKANLIFTRSIPSLAYLPYSFGTNLIDKVMVNGDWIQN